MGPSSSASDDFEIIDSQEASLTPDALAELQAWLQPTDYTAESSEFHRHLSSQAPGTGLWIGETTRFRQWHDSGDNGSLWIKGVPGAGKSVIAASMIQHLKATESAPVLFFFFRYIISANRTPRSLVRDWLSQLLPHSPRLQASLQPLLDGELDDVSDQRLWEHLLIGLSSVERAYCVLDALDEMELAENDDFLQRLNCLSTFRPDFIKVLMTSRPKQYLQSSMRDASIVHINLEDDLVGRDIELFVSHRLRNAVPKSDQADTRTSLDSIICSRSRGLFLYARLLLDQLIPILRSEQHVDVEHLAESLPVGLEDMYNSMLIRQSQSLGIGRTIQVFLLEYAIHSSRNLRLNELANILAYKFPPSMIPGTPKAIARTACAPLLEIMEDETVQIIHHSFTEFLLGGDQATERPRYSNDQFPTLNPIIVHKKLAMDCLDYLQSGVLRPEDQESENGENNGCDGKIEDPHDDSKAKRQDSFNYQDARLRHPFLEYAVTNWAYHASKYDVDEKGFFASINNFVDPESADFNTWLSLEDTTRWTSSNTELPSGLHLAAFAGLTHYAMSLLDQGQHIDGLDADERTPLLWAAKRGHPEMVRLLLHHGAKPDAEDCRGVKPIHAAAKKNEAVIVKMLLEAGVDPLDPKTREDNLTRRMLGGQRITKGETAVRYVCEKGYAEVILAMLPFVRPETLEELLCECCRYGKFEAASAVLRNSAVSVNAKFCGATALFLAVLARSVACVEMLLANGADVNSISEWKPVAKIHCGGRRTQTSRTPLHTLARNWSDENHKSCHQIFRMLLAAGANLQGKDGNGNTPLLGQFESRRRYSVLAARSLLEAGADANAVDPQGDTVLHRFLNWDRDIEILEMLLNHGANINARGKYGSTPPA